MDKPPITPVNSNQGGSDKGQSAVEKMSPRESENQQLRDEFNLQRAKMKDLYLQKEEEVKLANQDKNEMQLELDMMRKQLQHFELVNHSQKSEIQSLQLLVQETVEESSNVSASNVEMHRLRLKCTELEQQVNLLTRQATSSPDISIAPSALVQAVTKRIARRLGADPNSSSESLEDSMKKAQEDADVLRSLVVPLEEEITVLKDKLRETDSQLQQATQANESKARSSKASDSMNSSSRENLADGGCDMCANYEAQLVSEQAKSKEHLGNVNKLEIALKRAVEELERESSLRRDTLAEWRTARTEMKTLVESLTARVNAADTRLTATAAAASQSQLQLLDNVTQLTVDRETLQDRLDNLQLQNEKLMGKYSTCADDLRTQCIDLPNTLPELQEYALNLREELIIAVMGRERAQESEQTLSLLQAHAEELERHNDILKHDNEQFRTKFESFAEEREQMKVIGDQLRSTHQQLTDALEKKKTLENKVLELRSRVTSLQQDLDNSEMVQQDFVKLSQSLQVELERIRGSDVEVRWQHDEDIEECSSCHASFSNVKRKQHCRHCGRIFCMSCLTRSVSSGPRGRAAPVCDVCHTLLVRNTAPYFSTEVPHTPD